MSYKDRIKRLNARFAATKGAVSTFAELPRGRYDFVVAKALLIKESKAKFAAGQLEIQLHVRVLTGEHKGKLGFIKFFLEQPEKKLDSGAVIPDGLSQFKGFCESMGIELKQLSEDSLRAALTSAKDMKLRGYSTGSYGNVQFNGPVDVADDDSDDFEEEAEDTEEESEAETKEPEEESEEEEAEEPPPKKKGGIRQPVEKSDVKVKSGKTSKKAEAEDDDLEFDDEDF